MLAFHPNEVLTLLLNIHIHFFQYQQSHWSPTRRLLNELSMLQQIIGGFYARIPLSCLFDMRVEKSYAT